MRTHLRSRELIAAAAALVGAALVTTGIATAYPPTTSHGACLSTVGGPLHRTTPTGVPKCLGKEVAFRSQTGLAGANSINGNRVLKGTSAPISSLGSNGDFYLNTAANVLYGPKAGDAWPPRGTRLTAPDGTKGTDSTAATVTRWAVGKATCSNGGIEVTDRDGKVSYACTMKSSSDAKYDCSATPYPGIDLADCNLAAADLNDANLSGANLTDAWLIAAHLNDAFLIGANLGGAYLSGANLHHADLSRANLNDGNLNGANLSGANLGGAYLRGANLGGTYLSGANLGSANLTGAHLNGANLAGATLHRANLHYANLTGSTLTGALLDGVMWADTTCPDGTNSDNDRHTCADDLG